MLRILMEKNMKNIKEFFYTVNKKTLTTFIVAIVIIIVMVGVNFIALYESSRKNIVNLGKDNA